VTRTIFKNRAGATKSDPIRELLERTSETFNSFDGMFDVYLACFCEEGDLLSQWRAYGANGGGFCIGLESRDIGLRTPLKAEPDFVLRRVFYTTELLAKLKDELITDTLPHVEGDLARSTEGSDQQMVIGSYCHFFAQAVAEFLFCFKHPTFHEEKEWRAVFVTPGAYDRRASDRVKFRATPSAIVPYVELDLSCSAGANADKLPITKIVHGPTLHPELTKKSLSQLLQHRDYHFVDVEGSSIPYRA
jgi:hypothetical protein